mgnify:CR=1 FL=1
MKQYYAVKAVHPDAILLFRVGDFYETFGDDAIKASGILGITLTRRANGAATFVELAGFPYHAIDTYLPKLVRAGERVAICEQLEDPKQVKGLVKRGVIELVTPGVVLGDNILANKENTYLAAVYFGRKNTGVAFLDISTGEFYAAEGSDAYIDKLISNLAPKEIIYQRGYEDRFSDAFGSRHYTYRLDEWVFSESVNRDKLCKQFGTQSLKGFGIEQFSSGISAAGAILYYLEFTEHKNTAHISSISRIDQEDYVWVDKFTIRNLELFSSNGSREKCAFADVVDRTLTPMGGRLLKRWIALPIKEIDRINERLDVVQRFYDEPDLAESVAEQISQVGDLERIASRIAAARVTPREIVQLKNSLSAIELLKALLESTDDERLHALAEQIDLLAEVRERIAREVYPDPQNNQIQRGGIIADGVDAELDDLRRIALHGKDFLNRIQQRESEATGIPLKISYNNVFGYYIEVRNTHKDKVPESWIRKQTLANAERYITEELKEYEEKILGAEEKMLLIEQRIYAELIGFITHSLGALQRDAAVVARIDCLQSFARIARERNYVRPTLDDGTRIEIRQGRHPVIETLMPVGEEYIPNDLLLDDKEQQIVMITGPNMSGKSALLRQTALIILMAQMGSFVPAKAAHIVEYIHEHPNARAKTLFATHYHELNEMEQMCPRVKNYHVSVKEVDKTIVFLRKLERGGTEHSFGIHVARMAGMPASVVARAEEILKNLELVYGNNEIVPSKSPRRRDRKALPGVREAAEAGDQTRGMQLSMFQLDDPVLVQIRDQIKGLDINALTPIEALNKLNEIKKITGL